MLFSVTRHLFTPPKSNCIFFCLIHEGQTDMADRRISHLGHMHLWADCDPEYSDKTN